jgi:uncharacterized lipoprotein YmbA
MRAALALSLAVLLAACGSSPPARFYTLAAPVPAAGTRTLDGPAITVGPVSIPEAIDRPQMVTHRAANEVRVDEFARWAAPLRAEIGRVLGEHLSALRPDARIAATAAAPFKADYRIALDVRRFELAPGEAATLDAVWTLSAADKTLRSTRVVLVEPVRGDGLDALVAAQSRALERLAREIAPALPAR